MARNRVRLDRAGVSALLKSPLMARVIKARTEQAARAVERMGIMVDGIPGDTTLPVETSMTTTDRAHGSVTIAHPSGQAVQAKHGALTKAAAQAGLEVREK